MHEDNALGYFGVALYGKYKRGARNNKPSFRGSVDKIFENRWRLLLRIFQLPVRIRIEVATERYPTAETK